MNKPSTLIKPTLDTKFHIDYEWWNRNTEDDLHTYLLSHLPQEWRDQLSHESGTRVVDYINPDTGEVIQLDELGLAIQEAARDPNFINPQTSLVDSIFRVLLVNGNAPQSPRELAVQIGRPAGVILKMLSGGRVYKGIRPIAP